MKFKTKKGITLIETIVAIAIFLIGIEGVTLLFSNAWRTNSFIFESGEASFKASRGVRVTVDAIRNSHQADNGAFPIISANDNDLVIYTNVDQDNDTERVHYYLDNGTFKMGITDPTGDIPPIYPAGDQVVNNITDYIANNAGTPVFEYYDINNAILSTPATVNSVKMVKVHLEVNIDPNKAPESTDIQSYATIRNLSEYDRAN